MQQIIKLLLLSVLLCLLPCGSAAQKPERKTRKSAPAPICKIASVPRGMVVVGHTRNAACPDGIELSVKLPEDGDIICADSPVPPGFSIVTEAQGALIGSCPKKAFLISHGKQSSATEQHDTDDAIARAFASRASGVQVEGEGTVIRVLSDDLDQPRHQRFIVQLASGQTVLITHNIDIAPRIDELAVSDSVRFNGEYVWNAKGGVIHWTHHDPRGKHIAGRVVHNGKTYQ